MRSPLASLSQAFRQGAPWSTSLPVQKDVELAEKLLPYAEREGEVNNATHKSPYSSASSASTEVAEDIRPKWQPSLQPASHKRKLETAFYIVLNVVSTIAIVFLNKTIVRDEQLRNCQISFAAYHFFMTFFVLFLAAQRPFRMFDAVRLPILQILPLCGLFAGFLVLGNLSLEFNKVEFYQLTKMLTGPCVVLLNFLLFRETISHMLLLSVFITTAGVIIANGAFGLTHPFGAGIAVASLLVTAVYQIWIKKKIVDLNVSPPQLLLNQAPVAVLMLAGLIPIFDKVPDFRLIQSHVWVSLFTSGVVASLINLSQFLIIGATSSLTFNIIGALKTVGILSIGWYANKTVPGVMDIGGMLLALGGAWLYAHLSSRPKQLDLTDEQK